MVEIGVSVGCSGGGSGVIVTEQREIVVTGGHERAEKR